MYLVIDFYKLRITAVSGNVLSHCTCESISLSAQPLFETSSLEWLHCSVTLTDSISMDFIEGMPLSDGHDTILVVVCHLTKMALFIPTFREIDAEDLAHIFLLQVFAKHGTPTDIVSDRGNTLSHGFGSHSVSC